MLCTREDHELVGSDFLTYIYICTYLSLSIYIYVYYLLIRNRKKFEARAWDYIVVLLID
jgi:hypothetical protein